MSGMPRTHTFLLLLITIPLLFHIRFVSAHRLPPEVTARSSRADSLKLPQQDQEELPGVFDLEIGVTGSVKSIGTQKMATGESRGGNRGMNAGVQVGAPSGGWTAGEGVGGATTSSLNPGGGRDADGGATSVAECSLACSSRLLKAWPWETVGNCYTNQQCAMCSSFCRLLQNKQNIKSLCIRDECGPGCRAACNYVMGIADSSHVTMTYLVAVIAMAATTAAILGLCLYLAFIIYRCQRPLAVPNNEESLSWRELQLLDTPPGDRSRTKLGHVNESQPLGQRILGRLVESRGTNSAKSLYQTQAFATAYIWNYDTIDKLPPPDVTQVSLTGSVFI